MGIFECNFCKTKDSVRDSKRYKHCKLADGIPCIPCSKTIELDDLITQTRKNLNKLLHQKRDLYTEINFSHERIIHHLPPEVSTSIFLFSLSEVAPNSVLENPSKRPTTITTPLTLGAVCRVWRSIIWAAPQLWTNVSIPVKHTDPDYKIIDIAHEWLSRSGQLPLLVVICAPRATFSCGYHDFDLLDHLSYLMSHYLRRCCRLEIFCPVGLFPSITGEAPLLQELQITSDDDEQSRHIKLYSIISQGLRVSVKGYYLDSLELPFANVQEFEGFVTLDECVSILEKSPNLQEYRILGLKRSSIFEDNNLPSLITHDRLKKLTLHSEQSSLSMVLQVLQLPSLTHFTVSNIDSSLIRSFVLRSCCTLQCLSLDSLHCDDSELGNMLRSTNSLEELHLIQKHASDFDIGAFLLDLAQTPVIRKPSSDPTYSGCPLLPNLSILTIKFCDLAGFSWDQAAGIFGSIDDMRDPLRRPIKDFQMIYDWPIPKSIFGIQPSGYGEPIPSGPFLLDKEVTRQFLGIAGEGINITLYHTQAKYDILRLAMVHHNIAVPEWYKTKEPAGDSDLKFSENASDLNSSDEESDSNEFEDSEVGSELDSDLLGAP